MQKIRNLLVDPVDEHISLRRLMFKLQACSGPLSELEVRNTKVALKNAKAAINDFKKEFVDFQLRINTTITQEVLTEVSANTANGITYGNPSKLIRKISKNDQALKEKSAALKKSDLELQEETEEEDEDYF